MTESERYIKRQTARRVVLTAKGDLDNITKDYPEDAADRIPVDIKDLRRISQALDNAVNALIGT